MARKRFHSLGSSPEGLETIVDPFTGEVRVLGTMPTEKGLLMAAPLWSQETATPLIPEAEWPNYAFDIDPAPLAIKDQDSKGACNGHAAALTLEMARWAVGHEHVGLSAWFIYAILCNGRDVGSNIGEALKLLEETGTSTEATMPYGEINPARIPAAAKAEAPRFKITTGQRIETFDEMVTACILREPMNFSLRVGNNFNDLDSEGAPGVGRGPGNHAVTCYGGLKMSKKWGVMLKMWNSWSQRWGVNGKCWIARAHVESASWFECYRVVLPSQDPDKPDRPVAK